MKPYRGSFDDSLLVRPVLEPAELLRMREVDERELVEAARRRLEERDGQINAFCFVDADRALAEAERISPDDPRPLAGVPIAIKDSSPQEGLPMRLARRRPARYRGRPGAHRRR